jgi:hypothetical protein
MEIDKDNIVRLAGMVRSAQKRYFKDRTQENLIASKQLERELDNALEGRKPNE